MSEPVLSASDVSVRFGGIKALDDASIDVRPGEIVGLLGPNGAGKTTLFNVVCGFVRPQTGTIRLNGDDISHLLPYERVAAGLGRTFQRVRMFPNMTVRENLLASQHRRLSSGSFAAMLRLPSWRRDEERAASNVERMLDMIDLRPWEAAYPSQLSFGTMRFLELASVLSLEPGVLLLDEMASGIQQKEVEALGPILRRIRDDTGCAILLIEHDMRLLLGLSERVYALDFGRVIAEGTPDEVTSDPYVLSSYLGRTRRADASA